jgi:hypothetical protein
LVSNRVGVPDEPAKEERTAVNTPFLNGIRQSSTNRTVLGGRKAVTAVQISTQLTRLHKNSSIVIPRAGLARGICFFLAFVKKRMPRCARDDNNALIFSGRQRRISVLLACPLEIPAVLALAAALGLFGLELATVVQAVYMDGRLLKIMRTQFFFPLCTN